MTSDHDFNVHVQYAPARCVAMVDLIWSETEQMSSIAEHGSHGLGQDVGLTHRRTDRLDTPAARPDQAPRSHVGVGGFVDAQWCVKCPQGDHS